MLLLTEQLTGGGPILLDVGLLDALVATDHVRQLGHLDRRLVGLDRQAVEDPIDHRLVLDDQFTLQATVGGATERIGGGAPQALHPGESGEGDIAASLGELAETHPEVSIGSYPFQRDGIHGSNVVVRSQDGAQVEIVMSKLHTLFPEAV